MAEKKNGKNKPANSLSGLSFAVIVLVILGLVSIPAMLLLLIGMLPTLGAFVSVGSDEGKAARALSVTCLNFAGCFPFLLKIIANSMSLEKGLEIITDPLVIVVIYATAGAGYIVDALLSGYISSFLFTRAQARLAQIEKRQTALAERWGEEVTGRIPLDEDGFAVKKK